jgi:fatty acid desaturase
VALVVTQGALRVLGAFVITFIYLVAIWGAIALATRIRGYWFLYVPALAAIAALAWLIARSGRDRRHDHRHHPDEAGPPS